jgi:hypothetical protein
MEDCAVAEEPSSYFEMCCANRIAPVLTALSNVHTVQSLYSCACRHGRHIDNRQFVTEPALWHVNFIAIVFSFDAHVMALRV